MKDNNFFSIPKKGDSITWKEIIIHRNIIEAGLKWCIVDERKVCFWTNLWVYMKPLISFLDENNLQQINKETKVIEFINQDNLQSIASLLPPKVIAYIKAISIPLSHDRLARISLKTTNLRLN